MRKTIPKTAAGLMVALAAFVPQSAVTSDAIMDFRNRPNRGRFDKLQFDETGGRPKPVLPKSTATIQSVRIKHGKTIEKYSNGLVVKIDPRGNRKEILKSEEYVFEATVPSEYGKESSAIVDDFIDTLLLFGLQDGKCSPQHQSRLYQFANYYLSINEPKKAAPLILRYIEIKREIHENGVPLSDAEKIYLTALETVSAKNHLFDSRRKAE